MSLQMGRLAEPERQMKDVIQKADKYCCSINTQGQTIIDSITIKCSLALCCKAIVGNNSFERPIFK